MRKSKKIWLPINFRQRIQTDLLLYYLTPLLMVIMGSGGFFYLSSYRLLDNELGERLKSIAVAATTQVRDFHITALRLKDPDTGTYLGIREKLLKLKDQNDVEKIYIFDLQNESLVDTKMSNLPGTPYGQNLLHQAEILEAKSGRIQASVLFGGSDGHLYKSAFAPILDDGKVLAIVGVDGNARFFKSLHLLGKQLLYFALAIVLVVTAVSVLLSRRIVSPIQLLVEAAQEIGEGNLEKEIKIQPKNEIGFLGYVLDEMRRNLVRRDKELQMMLRGIAHEVRNPLGGMELFVGMLDEEISEPRQKEFVARIKNELRVLKMLVEEFLDFARGPVLELSQNIVREFLTEAAAPFQLELPERKVELQILCEPDLRAEFDSDQMRRAFLNLLRNSIQAMPEGGLLVLKALPEGTGVCFTIEDTGEGIEPEKLRDIFEPFFTTKEKGSGLGLSFVRKIVNAHGGEVGVQSQYGAGTSVSISLPGRT